MARKAKVSLVDTPKRGNWAVAPADWPKLRLRFLTTSIEQGWSPQCFNHPAGEDEWGVLKVGCVNGHHFDPQENKQLPSDLAPDLHYEIRDGDILMSRANTKELLGSAALVRAPRPRLLLCDKLYRITPTDKVDRGYLTHALRSKAARFHYEREATGASGSMQNIAQETIKSLTICLPPVEVQRLIAKVLDYKTAQIDALIAKKQTLLDKLAEKRVALATQAITEGLNELAERIDSGVPWLSRMPTHWGFKRLRFLTTMDGGMTPSTGNAEYWDGDIPWVSPKDMKRERLQAVPDNLTAKALQDTGIRLNDSGRVLIVVRGMILAHTFPVAINDVPVTINQDMKALSPVLDADYLALVLRGLESVVLSIVEESAHGTKVMRTDLFKNLVLPVPPMEEQRDIVRAVQALTQESDKMATAVSSAISKLQEYRSSLITHAVTGQIDVRHVPIPEPAHA